MSSKSASSVVHEGGAGFDTTTIQPSTELTPPMHEPMEPHLHIEHLDGLVDGGHDHDSELYTHSDATVHHGSHEHATVHHGSHEHRMNNGDTYQHKPSLADHDHTMHDEDSPTDKMYHLMNSDTLVVVVSLIVMVILALVFRKLCMRLSKGKDRKKLVRVGLKGIADQMHNVTKSMSNDLEVPDSPKAVMRTYSNYNRKLRAQNSLDPSGSEYGDDAGSGGEDMENNNAQQPHDAAKRMKSRDNLRIAVLNSNQYSSNMNDECNIVEKVDVHEMKAIKSER